MQSIKSFIKLCRFYIKKKKTNQTSKDFGNDAVGVQMPLGD